MVVLAAAAQAYGRRAANLSYDRLLTASILAMAETVLGGGPGAQDWDMNLPYAALDMLAMAPDDRVFYSLRSPAGELVTGYDDLPAAPEGLRARAAENDTPVFFDAIFRGEATRFALAGRWSAGAPEQGRAWLQVGQTRRAREALAAEIAGTATLVIAALTIAALALCWWSVRRGLAPLGRLERELAGRDAADLQAIATAVPAEMAHAVGALNRFMGRLAANLDTLRLFIAEAAHQMRTPLAALRAQAQMALDEPDAVEQRRGLLAVERNAAQLTRLLNQLLADASVDHRGTLQRFGPIDLVRTVREALHEAVPRADPRPEVRFDSQVASAPLQGDALMLREAVKNLVDNALRHGGRAQRPDADHDPIHAAEVDLSLQPSTLMRGGWCLCVADRGPGIAADDLPAVFERFGRGGDAAAGGAGLGLAIVRKVVDSHGGRIALAPRAGGGLVVQLDLPGTPTRSPAA
ncbi:sensor histidine kinase [Xylophilus sp. Kf1]|nr:sensor histidine kinase [Xylophilus sp. Kf1]